MKTSDSECTMITQARRAAGYEDCTDRRGVGHYKVGQLNSSLKLVICCFEKKNKKCNRRKKLLGPETE